MRDVSLEPLVLLRVGRSLVQQLECALHPAHVVGVYELCAPCVALSEHLPQRRGTPLSSHFLVLAAHVAVCGASGKIHLVYHGIKVEPRATAQHGYLVVFQQRVNAGPGITLEDLDGVV